MLAWTQEMFARLQRFLVSLLRGRGIRQRKVALKRFSFCPLEALGFVGQDTV